MEPLGRVLVAVAPLLFWGALIWACIAWESGKKQAAGAVFAVLIAITAYSCGSSGNRDDDDEYYLDEEYDDPRSSTYDR